MDWQEDLRDVMRELASEQKRRGSGDKEPEQLTDFGFTYPVEYVQRAVLFLDKWNVLPDRGGWANQDSALIDDILTYQKLKDRIEWEVEHEVNTDYGNVETDVPTLRLEDI